MSLVPGATPENFVPEPHPTEVLVAFTLPYCAAVMTI